jgi:hypothetical protein
LMCTDRKCGQDPSRAPFSRGQNLSLSKWDPIVGQFVLRKINTYEFTVGHFVQRRHCTEPSANRSTPYDKSERESAGAKPCKFLDPFPCDERRGAVPPWSSRGSLNARLPTGAMGGQSRRRAPSARSQQHAAGGSQQRNGHAGQR